jgi:hypothetical protein
LLSTLGIEGAVAFLLGCRTPLRISAVILASLVTHPAIHGFIVTAFFFNACPSPLPLGVILFLEAGVVLAETAILAYALRFPGWRAGLVSLTMNAASYLYGVWAG